MSSSNISISSYFIKFECIFLHSKSKLKYAIFDHLNRPTLSPKYKATPIKNIFIGLFKLQKFQFFILLKAR